MTQNKTQKKVTPAQRFVVPPPSKFDIPCSIFCGSLFLPNGNRLLPAKQLAHELNRSTGYIYAMKRDGFQMPGGSATINQALQWLVENPNFRKGKPLDFSAK